MIRKIQSIFAKDGKTGDCENGAAGDVDDLSSMEPKIKAIMAKCFKIDIYEINDETSADNIEQWNSLQHVELMVDLQKAFDVEFTDSQLVEMLSYKTVVQSVMEAITARSRLK
jgi:acyl carrier protein